MSARRRLAVLLLGFAVAPGVASGQKPEPIPPPVFLESGSAVLALGEREIPLPYATTASGALVALAPVAAALGGNLTSAGSGFSLRVGDSTFLLGVETSQVVVGRRIFGISQRPALTPQGLLVPLDLLEKSFGETTGDRFGWDAQTRRLTVDRRGLRQVEVNVELAHLAGTSTLVLRFGEERPHYRVAESPGRIEVLLQGERFAPGTTVAPISDPLVRAVAIDPDRARIDLEPGVSGSSYELDSPFRLVIDLRRGETVTSPGLAPGLPGEAGGIPAVPPGPGVPPLPGTLPSPRPAGLTIVIDPGHGGAETGAIGKGGTQEKALTLLLARALEAQIRERLGARVLLTREDDAIVPLRERTAIANESKADLFLSIHLNSSRGGRPQGAETYFLSLQASDAAAARAAEAENPADSDHPGLDSTEADSESSLELILWDLAQSRYLTESQRLATLIQGELNAALGLKDRGVKQAPFAVLTGAAMPAVLLELGFLSNPEEERKLGDATYRDALAAAVARALERYRTAVQPATESPATASPVTESPVTESPGPPGETPAEPSREAPP